MTRRLAVLAALLAATAAHGQGAAAFPSPPGGSNDVFARAIAHTTSAAVQKNLPYDSVKSFTGVAMIGKGPLLLAVTPRATWSPGSMPRSTRRSREEVKACLVRGGAEPAPMTPEASTALVAGGIARWRKGADSAGIKAD